MPTENEIGVDGDEITHPDRVMYPEEKITKQDIVDYYIKIADKILPYLKNRPLSLYRCPRGRTGECFFQKHFTDSIPEQIGSITITEKDGTTKPYLFINSIKGLIAAVQISTLELHVWGCRADRLDYPERLVFDLDPDPSIDFATLRQAATDIRNALNKHRINSYPLVTGVKGIHVIAKISRRKTWNGMKNFCRELAESLVDEEPSLYTSTPSKTKRKSKIYIDWHRNERGATAVVPYSLRARKGAPVAMPLTWDELSTVKSADQYTIDNVLR